MPLKTDVQAGVIQVICVKFLRGEGKDESDPVREVTAYFNLDGEFLCENDEFKAK